MPSAEELIRFLEQVSKARDAEKLENEVDTARINNTMGKLMYDELVRRLRDAAKMSEALAVFLPNSEGNATAKLYNEAADAIEELQKRVPPVPHGRLIDADALIDKVIAKYLEHERKGELVFAAAEIKQDIVDLISDAPTIIPASFENLPKSKESQKIEEGET